jgi:hypothetical protein
VWAVSRRTALDLQEAVRPSRKGHLFEHFIVVGWPPSVRVNPKVPPQQQLAAPTILYKARAHTVVDCNALSYPTFAPLHAQYPEEDSKRSSLVEDAVVHFCFPNKVPTTIVVVAFTFVVELIQARCAVLCC